MSGRKTLDSGAVRPGGASGIPRLPEVDAPSSRRSGGLVYHPSSRAHANRCFGEGRGHGEYETNILYARRPAQGLNGRCGSGADATDAAHFA